MTRQPVPPRSRLSSQREHAHGPMKVDRRSEGGSAPNAGIRLSATTSTDPWRAAINAPIGTRSPSSWNAAGSSASEDLQEVWQELHAQAHRRPHLQQPVSAETILAGAPGITDPLAGFVPDSWLCVDCGVHTAPGVLNRPEMEAAIKAAGKQVTAETLQEWSDKTRFDDRAEIYIVRETEWAKADMQPFGGCLCIGCLEKRLGRKLKPKDFDRDHVFTQHLPGTAWLLNRLKRQRR
jgi:hypothetical protein